MKKRRINKWYEPELVYIIMISIFVFIISLILANCYRENPVFSSFAINISVSALTVLFTVMFVDGLQKKARERNELELEKIISYQNYKLELENDKQNTVGHLFEIIGIMKVISNNYSNEKDSCTDANNYSHSALLLEYLKLKIILKLNNLPRRPSFNEFAMVRVNNATNPSNLTTITSKLFNTSEGIAEHIGKGHVGKSELFKYEAELVNCVVDILNIVPRKFEDIKDEL